MSPVTKNYENFSVKVLADSAVDFGPYGRHRLITIEANYPRIIHAELMTHRMKSINAASSRAIPIEKMIQSVIDNPFKPDLFPRSHKGMQASNWFAEDGFEHKALGMVWLSLRDTAVVGARLLNNFGVSKQLANRLLEPFLMYRAIISGTEWENMIALRAHSDAQHEFQILAGLMLDAFNESIPIDLPYGEWHIPFGDQFDYTRLQTLFASIKEEGRMRIGSMNELSRMIATARCARISYNNFEGGDDYAKDLELYMQLRQSGHWSPFEHVAQAMTLEEYLAYTHSAPGKVEYGWLGNYRGFKQLRKTYPPETESRLEPRLLSK